MKAVILAGGLGTRISEESSVRPKPMVEIGGRPILWHVMKTYSHFGINDFVICLGYKGAVIKEFFANYALLMSDVTIRLETNEVTVHHRRAEPWSVTLVDTGEHTMTGGRLKAVRNFLGDEDFCFTYGDGVSDVDIGALVAFHRAHGRLATVTSVVPPGRYGALDVGANDQVKRFLEKPRGDGGVINGGYFVLSPKVIDLIEGDQTSWEAEPLEALASGGNLFAYHHRGFWHPMDTLRDKNHLESLWAAGNAPWKLWQ